MSEKDFYLSEEILIVRHSGEIPEVAYHGSLYFLTDDQEGPGLELVDDDLTGLKEMVVERYCEIINRDLNPENRDKGLYRGLKRAAVNWQRLQKFCARETIPLEMIQKDIAADLLAFMENEVKEVCNGTRSSSINCTAEELRYFCSLLDLACDLLPPGWQQICCRPGGAIF